MHIQKKNGKKNKPMQRESDFGGRKCLFRKFRALTDVYLRLFTFKLRWLHLRFTQTLIFSIQQYSK